MTDRKDVGTITGTNNVERERVSLGSFLNERCGKIGRREKQR